MRPLRALLDRRPRRRPAPSPCRPRRLRPAPPVLVQECGGTSWWAGTTNVCDGRVVYRDYVNDDHGADTGGTGYEQGTQNAFGTLAHPAGDLRYPADRISSADLVRLELTRVGSRIDVVAEVAGAVPAGRHRADAGRRHRRQGHHGRRAVG